MTEHVPERSQYSVEQLETVWQHCGHHRDSVLSSSECACFFCLKRFDPRGIRQWTDGNQTAICPLCGIDSVLPDNCNVELTPGLLRAMNQKYFDGHSARGDSNA